VRAIASATGTSEGTVRRSLSGAPNGAPEPPASEATIDGAATDPNDKDDDVNVMDFRLGIGNVGGDKSPTTALGGEQGIAPACTAFTRSNPEDFAP